MLNDRIHIKLAVEFFFFLVKNFMTERGQPNILKLREIILTYAFAQHLFFPVKGTPSIKLKMKEVSSL